LCGISLLFEPGGCAAAPAIDVLASMDAAQRHRGPDGAGWLLVDGALRPTARWRRPDPSEIPTAVVLGAAFRRLIVQDPADAARQPLAAPDEPIWILHNGEIYNQVELRHQLGALGHPLPGRGDAEVALAAYREWGTDCFERFRGMWAMLIVDLARGRLIGSRDRLGIKPLFWSARSGRLALASEPGALRSALNGSSPEPDPVRLREFLEGLPPRDPERSFYRGLRPVPAASWFEIDLRAPIAGPPTFHRFWRLSTFHASGEVPAFETARATFAALIEAAVHEQLEASVPVGTLLSGGLDSSVVTALAARDHGRHGRTPPPAFSIVYEDPAMSEWPYIVAAARRAGVKAHTYTLTAADAWRSVDAVVRAQGQPLLGQDLIAQYHAYRIAREHGAIVVLDGQGADELLGGLPLYAGARYHELLAALRLRELTRELRALAHRQGESLARAARGQLLGPVVHAARDRVRLRRYTWLPPAGDAGGEDGGGRNGATTARSSDASLLNRRLFELVAVTNLPTVLLHQDRSSMAHGVESRVPFLDHRIVELCFGLPPEYKVHSGIRKRLLWESAHDVVPPVVLERRDKRKFISRADWLPLRTQHAAALRGMARSPSLVEGAGLSRPALVRFVDDFLDGRHDDHFAVWRLFTLSRWLELC
jgi:asparagine synthase (glutamine-hydrolysing)